MSPDLEKQLRTKYDKIFPATGWSRNIVDDEYCDITCSDGWFDILDQLCATIQSHLDHRERMIQWELAAAEKRRVELENAIATANLIEEHPISDPLQPISQVRATQVKEKFGTLRFYCSGGDEYISGAISMATAMSAKTCETCGAPGTVGGGPWIRAACPEHTKK